MGETLGPATDERYPIAARPVAAAHSGLGNLCQLLQASTSRRARLQQPTDGNRRHSQSRRFEELLNESPNLSLESANWRDVRR